MDMYQVNVSTEQGAFVTPYNSYGYKGMLYDDEGYTDWCIFYGTQEECEDYIEEHCL